MNENLQLYLSLLNTLNRAKTLSTELLNATQDAAVRDSFNLINASIEDLTTSHTAMELVGR
jgi:hypothetical protein